MPPPSDVMKARVHARTTVDCLLVEVSGQWKITEPRPSWSEVIGGQNPDRVRIELVDLESWDSSLILFIFEAQQWTRVEHVVFDEKGLPARITDLIHQLSAAQTKDVPADRRTDFLSAVGLASVDVLCKARD